ncbi:beta strand repeat-containing protein [Polynucleobacter sp. HIN5]|uniref:beta strand repeat-containing protein n=1 Tax=Polynucleobacter sp. HIN5 TaxID=3047864 RepID=UPI0025742255|nr:autotransporter outer membrane beta-barrel domain-containing protein [Polynucleobacter sp. HIN5]BEI32968.1 hypothetical protein PHIN5_03360 [Polynucleobacter sp. HIN5]
MFRLKNSVSHIALCIFLGVFWGSASYAQSTFLIQEDATLSYDANTSTYYVTDSNGTFPASFPLGFINATIPTAPVTVNIDVGNTSPSNTYPSSNIEYLIIDSDSININAISGFMPIQNGNLLSAGYNIDNVVVARDVVFSYPSLLLNTTVPLISNNGTIGLIENLGSLTNTYTGIYNTGTINQITNTGTISVYDESTIKNTNGATINSIVNGGNILATGITGLQPNIGIENTSFSTIGSIQNTGTIAGDSGGSGNNTFGILNSAVNSITTVTNSGVISATGDATAGYAQAIGNYGSVTNITNLSGGQITATSPYSGLGGGAWGIYNGTLISGTITNAGTISAYGSITAYGIQNEGTIAAISNTGLITGAGYGIDNTATGTITTITNDIGGAISGALASINNLGTINTLNNAQDSLTFTGRLPQNYGIILGSTASAYGKLTVTSATSWDGASGTTNFGIYGGSVKSTRYAGVISGVTASLLTSSSLTGTYTSGGKTYAYTLALESGSVDVWELLFPTYYAGPSIANTNQSLVNTASVLQGTYALQNSILANSFTYDCNVFGANNVCVSAGGRNTAVQAANGLNNTSALLIAAYRLTKNFRIGAYADQNLSVTNPGGTVNLGNSTPLVGLFGAWNQRLNGTGAEVKVAAAYGQKNATITRSAVGSGDGASEAGSGSSQLNSLGVQATAKYGFGITQDLIVSPYFGVRYTQNNMGGYTEATSSSVTAPLTYSALNTNATTALAGIGASYRVTPSLTTFASAGVETDTNTANGTYTASNASIGALTPVNFNANPVKTRSTATLGGYYDILKNQRIGITGIYRQEAYQAVSTTTVLATYTIGF